MKKRILTVCLALVLMLALSLPALGENAFAGVWVGQAAESGIGGMVMFDADGACRGSIASVNFEGTYTVSGSMAQVHSEGIEANAMTRLALVMAGLHPAEKNDGSAYTLAELFGTDQFVLSGDTLILGALQMKRMDTSAVDAGDDTVFGLWAPADPAADSAKAPMLFLHANGSLAAMYEGELMAGSFRSEGDTLWLNLPGGEMAVSVRNGLMTMNLGYGSTLRYVKTVSESNALGYQDLAGFWRYDGAEEEHDSIEGVLHGLLLLDSGEMYDVRMTEDYRFMAYAPMETPVLFGNQLLLDGENYRIDGSMLIWEDEYGEWETYTRILSVSELSAGLGVSGEQAAMPGQAVGVWAVQLSAEEEILSGCPEMFRISEDGSASVDNRRVQSYFDGKMLRIIGGEQSLALEWTGEKWILSVPAVQIRYEYAAFDAGFPLTYREAADGIEITGVNPYYGALNELVIPEEIDGKPVVRIAAEAFKSRDMISVTIPSTVKEIGAGAFAECWALMDVNLPEGLKALPDSFMARCTALRRLTLPEGVESLGESCFDGCTVLAEINLPSTLRTMGDYVFANCKALKTLVIPEGVTHMNATMLYKTDSLESVYLPKSLERIEKKEMDTYYIIFSNRPVYYILYGAAVKNPAVNLTYMYSFQSGATEEFEYAVMEDGSAIITKWLGNATDVVVPAEVDGHPVYVVGQKALELKKMESVYFSDGIVHLHRSVLNGCEELKNLRLPSTLKIIDEGAFNNCRALESLYLPEGLETIGKGVLRSAYSLERLYIPATVTEIGDVFGSRVDTKLYVYENTAAHQLAIDERLDYEYVKDSIVVPDEKGSFTIVSLAPATPTFTPAPTLPPEAWMQGADQAGPTDGIPLNFCGHYVLDDRCSWVDGKVAHELWLYPDGMVYCRAEYNGQVMIKHGKATCRASSETSYDLDIRYHYQEGAYFHICDHSRDYWVKDYGDHISLDGWDSACFISGKLVGAELLDVPLVTPEPTPVPTEVPSYIVYEIPAEARRKDVPDSDPGKPFLGPWKGYYYSTTYNFYFAPDGVVYGIKYEEEYGVKNYFYTGQYTIDGDVIRMTWPEDVKYFLTSLGITEDPNRLILDKDDYLTTYMSRVGE